MKFYSESLKKLFDTQDELLEAEQKHISEKQEKEERKNELKAAVEVCSEELQKAHQEWKDTRDAIAELRKKCEETCATLEKEAREKYMEVRQRRQDAVEAYNKEFGVYTTTKKTKSAEEFSDWLNAWSWLFS